VIVLVVGAFLLFRSDRVHSYLLQTAQQKASQALGSEVGFRDFSFSWHGLGPSVELYGIVVHGAPPHVNPPLASLLRPYFWCIAILFAVMPGAYSPPLGQFKTLSRPTWSFSFLLSFIHFSS